jgi:hypothetical protein
MKIVLAGVLLVLSLSACAQESEPQARPEPKPAAKPWWETNAPGAVSNRPEDWHPPGLEHWPMSDVEALAGEACLELSRGGRSASAAYAHVLSRMNTPVPADAHAIMRFATSEYCQEYTVEVDDYLEFR